MITVAEYVGPYVDSPDWNPETTAAAMIMLEKVNSLLDKYVEDGGLLVINPSTGTLISGEKNGGFRPQNCPIGAPRSKHKTGHGVDVYCPAPNRELSRWCYAHPEELESRGLCMEDARWTLGWAHFQDVPPGPPGSPWRLDFIPDLSPAKCAALPEQATYTKGLA